MVELEPASITRFRLNGRDVAPSIPVRTTLLDWLRDSARLTGAKKGCDRGQCGACTVLINGERHYACLRLAVTVEGCEVQTIEGLTDAGESGTGQVAELHPVQQAFIDHDALQCGFCTPGQIMAGVAAIAEGHAGDAETVRQWMSGNICRCAAYPQIVAAVLAARAAMEG